eukprot:294919_1
MGINNDRAWYALASPYNPTKYLAYLGQTWAFTNACLDNCEPGDIVAESEITNEFQPEHIDVAQLQWEDDFTLNIDSFHQGSAYKCGVNVLFTDADGGVDCDTIGLNGIYFNSGDIRSNHAMYTGPTGYTLEYTFDPNGQLGGGQYGWYFWNSGVHHTSPGNMSVMWDVTEIAGGAGSW